jgi:hypothetical protein
VEAAKENDPTELKRKIKELQLQLKNASGKTDSQEINRAFERGCQQTAKKYGKSIEAVRSSWEKTHFAMDTMMREVGDLVAMARENSAVPKAPLGSSNLEVPRSDVTQRRPSFSPDLPRACEKPKSGIRRIMIALAQRPGLSARQIGVRAGLSSSSGTFDTYLSKLRASGQVTGSRDSMRLTPLGIEDLGNYEPLPQGKELLSFWLNELGGGASRMLTALVEAYPQALTRQELAIRAHMTLSGTFDTYLSKLRTLELVSGRGELKASEELVEERI